MQSGEPVVNAGGDSSLSTQDAVVSDAAVDDTYIDTLNLWVRGSLPQQYRATDLGSVNFGNRVSVFDDNSALIPAPHRATLVPVRKTGIWQPLICVCMVRAKRCPTSSLSILVL